MTTTSPRQSWTPSANCTASTTPGSTPSGIRSGPCSPTRWRVNSFAVASFAGTMPETWISWEAWRSAHGKLDMIIDYDDDWDWKDGEHEGVGTMSNIPGMIDAVRASRRCRGIHLLATTDVGRRSHRAGIEFQGHGWPDQVNGTETYRVNFKPPSEIHPENRSVSIR